jgi:hypothetical protein
MVLVEHAMTSSIIYPEKRNEVIDALRSLSDPIHQKTRWGRVEEGVNYFDDLTINVHTLYDDTQVLPMPDSAVPELLHEAEIPALLAVDEALGPMIRDLGVRGDSDYLADARWPNVVRAARAALVVMQACDEAGTVP